MQKTHELGVFVLFSTTDGDAWLLEVTESDALQVAASKEILTVDFEENPAAIKRIRKKYSPELLETVHIDQELSPKEA